MAHSAEMDPHQIVATRSMSGAVVRHTCSCGEVIDAHPDLKSEAFEFHLTQTADPDG